MARAGRAAGRAAGAARFRLPDDRAGAGCRSGGRRPDRVRAARPDLPDRCPAGRSGAEEAKRMSVEGVRVLIVEDEAIIAMTAEDMLEELGCVTAAIAATLAEAEAAVSRGGFDVALLDINL